MSFIFVQKNATELKELKKEGYTYVLDQLDGQKYRQLFEEVLKNQLKQQIEPELKA